MPKISKDELEWRRRADARTLVDAQDIANDPKRLNEARKALIEMEKEAKQKLEAINKVKRGKK